MTSTRQRRSGTARRAQIARAALRILGRRGRSALTTSRLAGAVGLSSGALFRHFASLDEIVDEAVQLATQRVDATFPATSLPPLERLLELARSRVLLLRTDPGTAWLLRSDQATGALPRRAVARLEAAVARSRAFLKQAVEEGVADGSLRHDVPPEALLLTVTGTIHALAGATGVHAEGATPLDLEVGLGALGTLLTPPRGDTR